MSLTKRDSYALEKSSAKSEVGTGLLLAGAGGFGLMFLASLIPFVGVFGVCVLLVLGGIALKL